MNTENIEKNEVTPFKSRQACEGKVNASQMAAAFNKRPVDWLRMKATKVLLKELAALKNVPVSALIIRIKNANPEQYDTWIDEDAALEFARWLCPSFAIWNNRHTKQLLLSGSAEIADSHRLQPAFASHLIDEVERTQGFIEEQTRKAFYHDTILQSRTLIPATVIAKELGLSAIALNKYLHEKKIIYKNDTHWLLYADYQGKGYTGTKTALYLDSAGKYQTNIHTYWTEKGREFIHALFQENKRIA